MNKQKRFNISLPKSSQFNDNFYIKGTQLNTLLLRKALANTKLHRKNLSVEEEFVKRLESLPMKFNKHFVNKRDCIKKYSNRIIISQYHQGIFISKTKNDRLCVESKKKLLFIASPKERMNTNIGNKMRSLMWYIVFMQMVGMRIMVR